MSDAQRHGSGPLRIVTTSWDDGHPLDARVAELLTKHGVAGTFYVPRSNPEHPVMDAAALIDLVSGGFEPGAHTLGHLPVTGMPPDRLRDEVAGSKAWLQDATGRAVTSFCYPRGEHDSRTRQAVRDAGFELGRTTLAMHLDVGTDPARLPVTMQVYPHGRAAVVRHALRHADLAAVTAVARVSDWSFDDVLDAQVSAMLERGGVLHLWGHSWEIDDLGWWGTLDDVLGRISGLQGVEYATNARMYRLATGRSEASEG